MSTIFLDADNIQTEWTFCSAPAQITLIDKSKQLDRKTFGSTATASTQMQPLLSSIQTAALTGGISSARG